MKSIEALNEMCLNCEKEKATRLQRCPFRSISNDYCEEYEAIEKELKQHEKLKIFIYKEKEKIDEQIKELDPDYNEPISDCEECEMWSRLFSKQELLEKIIKEVLEDGK